MDEDIARWILEFLLRQPLEDRIINNLLSLLPLSNHDLRLKKTLLLKRIESETSNGTVSEKILEALEMIAELDLREGKTMSGSVRSAYCAVAVDCTVRFLDENAENNGKYFEAVKQIWRGRVCEIEKNGGELVSEKLSTWKDEIEVAISDSGVRERILTRNTRNEALKAVRVYLSEAWEEMGPTFLELAAERIGKLGKLQEEEGSRPRSDKVEERVENRENGCRELVVFGAGDGGGGGGGGEHRGVVHDGAVGVKATQKPQAPMKRKHIALRGRQPRSLPASSRGAKICDADKADGERFINKYDVIPTPEVNRLQAALNSSSAELREVVTDPLPDALRMAETVSSAIPRPETQCKGNDPESSRRNEVQENATQRSRPERNEGHGPSNRGDSIDDSLGRSPNRPCLASPTRRIVSPLKENEFRKLVTRRRKMRWTPLEEDTLRAGVQKFGKGNWKLILNFYRDTFQDRTDVDLKDKWRNLTRYGV